MSSYEIGAKSARVIHTALCLLYERHIDSQTNPAPELEHLLGVFAPPEPPTAAELAKALRTALSNDYLQAEQDALAVLRRWDASQP